MRYRGPYEYDKFTLNILQISNAVTLSELQELTLNTTNKNTLLQIQDDINKVYKSLLGDENKMGLAERIYLDTFLLKEER
jgi:hypothetical protein